MHKLIYIMVLLPLYDSKTFLVCIFSLIAITKYNDVDGVDKLKYDKQWVNVL